MLTVNDFRKRLLTVSRCQPIGFTSIVQPSRLRKTNNPLAHKVRKVSIATGMINCLYETSVNRERLREGLPADFVAGPPSVGERVAGSPLCRHITDNGDERWYLEIFVRKVTSHYFCINDNRELNYFEEVKPFEYQKPIVDELRRKQGTKRVVRPTTYALTSIAEMRIAKESWSVRPLCSELRSYLVPPTSDSATMADSAEPNNKDAGQQ